MWNAGSPTCFDVQKSTDELIKLFEHSVHGSEAACEMLLISQGRRIAADYALEFYTLAISCDWNQLAQFNVFLNGLSER